MATPVQAPILIKAEIAFADPDTCMFMVSTLVQAGGPYFFSHVSQAVDAPLVEKLFALSGVATVLVSDNIVTVSKTSESSWQTLKAAIGSAIRHQLLSGEPALLKKIAVTQTQQRSNEILREVIQNLLDREVNRSIASHGGKISIVDLQANQLYVRMSGGCQGCASSEATLKQGFEVLVKRVAPEIHAIIDVTDHNEGKNPYFK